MKLIRNNIFETNSSSTHSLVIMSKEDYDAWQKHEKTINIATELGTVNDLDEEDRKIVRNEDGSVDYQDEHYDSIYDFMDNVYDAIEDDNASTEYIDNYAEMIKTELNDKVILSIYRGEIW